VSSEWATQRARSRRGLGSRGALLELKYLVHHTEILRHSGGKFKGQFRVVWIVLPFSQSDQVY
jgi:hypothetical protein